MSRPLRSTRWEIALPDRSNVPLGPGVYVFLLNGKTVYVGSSANLAKRLASHLRITRGILSDPPIPIWQQTLLACRIKFKRSRRFGDWLMLEARLIRRLRPAANVIGRPR
jgi:excinuclease UvrABC nuclease subunit